MSAPPRRPAGWLGSLLRSFAIQGSWNPRSLLGSGFAFALVPFLRRSGLVGTELARRTRRHLEPFNAHPYLSGVALGAVARMEQEGADAETVRRFKRAVQGPLGALGDNLMWGAWRPATLLFALAVAWSGTRPWVPALLFLALYNAGHLALRWWSLGVGLGGWRGVGARLEAARLPFKAERVVRAAALLLGVLTGGLLAGGLAPAGWGWSVGGMAGFALGLRLGQRVLRFATLAVVLGIVAAAAAGAR